MVENRSVNKRNFINAPPESSEGISFVIIIHLVTERSLQHQLNPSLLSKFSALHHHLI